MNRMKLGEILSVKHGWAFKGEYFAEDGEQSILTPGNFFEKGGKDLSLIMGKNVTIQEFIQRNICVIKAI